MTETHRNLLAAQQRIELPEDPAAQEVRDSGKDGFLSLVAKYPQSCLLWALLAEASLREDSLPNSISAYAFARTGYHRGLDALRRNGWRGSGHVPWEHVPNRGFLRALWALSVAAGRIGETGEQQRCAQFLRDSSETAFRELAG
ncbi:DUF3151 domain-containing protein [Tessaracoccus sp. OH4464_COT-324]|uniref:DUF3151 domain-containing protein n=1 Tax=Tessaracoccus sp. OH4464_COT-324 TaxID=2491059 RepID=UPI000F63D429|nr:DUF3151 domain-containing protein [Tessaracoccus sp. OH4464_COT-324]RRD46423.1 DUF3151 domain-containing protein [Tessaracoccus sp. OH4464_COT-324]